MKNTKPKYNKKKLEQKPFWLHLGCGKRNIPGFINVDIADFKHIHYKQPVNDLSEFKNNSADLIYASHVFEYFDKYEAKIVLKEWCRVLKKGATLRLAVPDFEALSKVYKKYNDLNLISGPLYGRWEVPGGKTVIYHKSVYDFNSLNSLLSDNGFKNIKRYDWKKTFPHSEHDDHSQAYIPHMKKESGILISLNIEAIKK